MNLSIKRYVLLVCLAWSEVHACAGVFNVVEGCAHGDDYKEFPSFFLDETQSPPRNTSGQYSLKAQYSRASHGSEQSLVNESQSVVSNAEAQAERDEIFSLLAMAVVLQDWQTSMAGRGHNIGSVLVTSDHQPVFYARNSILALDNATQHGEVRLVQNYLNCKNTKGTAKGLTVYTTLESCVMCAGMMAMTEVSRVVYIQKDPNFGGVREALKNIHYPRVYSQDTANELLQKRSLEDGYDTYRATGKSKITGYLMTEEARQIYKSAKTALQSYSIKFPENAIVLDRTLDYLHKIKTETFGDAMAERCPLP